MPEDIAFGHREEAEAAGSRLPCQVIVVEPMGSMNILVVAVGRQRLMVSTGPDQDVRAGEQGWLTFNRAKLHFFHRDSELNLRV